jgi:hypothetical protein
VSNLDSATTEALERFDSVREELLGEVRRVAKASLSGENAIYPSPTSLDSIDRRLAVRSIVSYIEAISFLLKGIAVEVPRSGKVRVEVEGAFRILAKKKRIHVQP